MKLNILPALLICFLTINVVPIKSQEIKWSKMLGSDKEEYVLSHVVDKDENVYVSGKTTGDIGGKNLGQNDGFIIKIDSSGKTVWTKQFGSEGDEDIQWSATDSRENIFITGSTTGIIEGKNFGKEDILIVKYSPDGEKLWERQIGTDSTDIAKSICTDSGNNIYITGVTGGKLGQVSYGKNDCFIMKLNNDGKILKIAQFGTSGDDLSYSVDRGIHGDIFICGTTWGDLNGSNHGFIDGFTGHFTSGLEKLDFHQFGTDGFDIPLLILSDKDDNLFVAGSTSGDFASPQSGEGDCFLMKMDKNGELIWNKQFGTNHHDGVRGLDINDSVSDNVFISGILNLPPEKAFIRIYSKNGDMIWEKIFELPGYNGGTSGKDIHIDNKGDLTHLGLTGIPLFGPMIGGHDAYIIKMNINKSFEK